MLSTDQALVRAQLVQRPAAMLFCPASRTPGPDRPLHLVFDWDSTLADNSGDLLIQREGRAAFAAHEWASRAVPQQPGPIYPLLVWAQGQPAIKTTILTARTGREAPRVFATLEAWHCQVDALHFAASGNKGRIAAAIDATLFLDDILRHVHDAVACDVCAGWVPYGTASE